MKKIFATLLSVAVLLALVLPAAALGTDSTVTMTAEGDRAAVTLTLPAQEVEGVTSLRLRFDVQTGEGAQVQFVFDQSLQSAVQQARYNASTGQLTIYLSGRQPLFTDGTVSLGEIRLSGAQNLTATVSLGGDALQMADGAYGTPEAVSLTAQPVQLTVGTAQEQPGGDSGDQNNGNENSGDQNNGNQGSGDQNNGNEDSGDQNNGNQNPGDQNNGNQNSGDQNNGNQNSGGQNNGGQNSGGQTSGNQTGGSQNTSAGDQTQNGTNQDSSHQTSPDTGDHSPQSELTQQQSVQDTHGTPWLTVAIVAAVAVLAVAATLAVILLRRRSWEQ